ncbi:MAG: ClcB-like voltage-gated chloride channel protein [Verrucomicrobiota bacterium]
MVRPETLDTLLKKLRGFIQRHWKRLLRIRERLRFTEETFHLMLAGIVGVIGGLTNIAFFFCIEWVTGFILHQTGDVVEVARLLEWWQRFLISGFGAMAAGLVLYFGLRLVGPQPGPTNLLEVILAGDGRLRMRSALVKAASSLVSLGTGASIGREGSITQLSATLASKAGQLAHWQPYRLRLLVACGAASGMAAAYNAPVAGAVFAAQIVLGNFSMNYFAPLVLASVVATMLSRSFFGLEPWYKVPDFEFTSLTQLPWFMVLGIGAGFLGAIFMKMIRYSEELFQKLNWPVYDRIALGGFLVGLLAIPYPEVWGNGYGPTNDILRQQFPIWTLLGLFLAKLLATVATVGSGAVGGLFTPTLFLGAGLGSLFALLLHWAGLSETEAAAYSVVGMGSVLAATIHSPLLAVILIFEISLNHTLLPPLMLACAISTIVARGLHPDSVYTEPLRRKGLELEEDSQQVGAATQKTVGELMREPVKPLRDTASFREMVDRFLTSSNNFLPVVDSENRLLGVVALQDMKEYLGAGEELSSVIAYDVMRPPPRCLTPNQKLIDALPTLLASELRNVPVVNSLRENRLVGSVVRAEALGLLSEAIAARKSE